MLQPLQNFVQLKDSLGSDFEMQAWGEYLNLGHRLGQISKHKYSFIQEEYRKLYWRKNSSYRFTRIITGKAIPNALEVALLCEILGCTIAEFVDSAFSFGKREQELRRQQEVQQAERYGLSYRKSA